MKNLSPTLSSAEKIRNVAVVCVLMAVTFLAYLPALDNGFTAWDDDSHLYDNVTVRSLSPSNIGRIFTSSVYDSYCPLTILSFAVEYHFVGYNPFLYHLDNVLLHIAVTLLVYVLALRLSLAGFSAFFAALIFGLHPLHVESVAWVTERKDVLYAFFYLLSILGYLNYADGRGKKFFVLSVLAGVCAMLSKAMALSLPLVLIVIDWYRQDKWDPRSLLNKIPHFLYVIPIAWITYSQNMRIPGRSIGEGILIWVWTLMFYLRKFVWPWHLYPYYPVPHPIELAGAHYYFALVNGFALVVYCLYRFRKNRLWIFSFLWFFVSIFFLLRYDTLIDTSVVSDRFMYLPCLGFCLLLGRAGRLALDWGKTRLTALVVLGVMLFVPGALFLKTYNQTFIWRNGISLWRDVVRNFPRDYYPYYFRAFAYSQAGRYQEALADYGRVIELFPGFYAAYNDRGMVYYKMRDYGAALKDFEKAIKISPQRYESFLNMGNVYLDRRELDKAEVLFKEALKRKPDLDIARLNLARIYALQKKGNMLQEGLNAAIRNNPRSTGAYMSRAEFNAQNGEFEEAVKDYTTVIGLDPTVAPAFVGRGNAYYSLGRFKAAVDDYTRALEMAPDLAEIYSNRGLAYLGLKDFPSAYRDFDRTLELAPDTVVALDNRAILHAQRGINDSAMDDLNRSLALVPDNPATYFNRGLILMSQGKYDEAVKDFEKCLELDENFAAARSKLEEAKDKLEPGAPANRPGFMRLQPTF